MVNINICIVIQFYHCIVCIRIETGLAQSAYSGLKGHFFSRSRRSPDQFIFLKMAAMDSEHLSTSDSQ